MNSRFDGVEHNAVLCEATILDPRFKKSGFGDPRNFDTRTTSSTSDVFTAW